MRTNLILNVYEYKCLCVWITSSQYNVSKIEKCIVICINEAIMHPSLVFFNNLNPPFPE